METSAVVQTLLQRLDCNIIGLYTSLENDVPSIRDFEISLSQYEFLRNGKNRITSGSQWRHRLCYGRRHTRHQKRGREAEKAGGGTRLAEEGRVAMEPSRVVVGHR